MTRTALFFLPTVSIVLAGCQGTTSGVASAPAPIKLADNSAGTKPTIVMQREAQLNRLQRDYSQQIGECGNGKMAACDKADKTRKQMEKLREIS